MLYYMIPKSPLISFIFQLVMLKSSVDLFYTIPGVPDKNVKPPNMKDGRIFIQSTSHGARCVKLGESILYKV